jgi:hypothetical protein
MRHLPLRVPQEAAVKVLRRHHRGLMRRLIQGPIRYPAGDAHLTRSPPFLEVIWMPWYVVAIHVDSPRGPGVKITSLDGWAGLFALFERSDNILDDDVVGEVFPPKIAPEVAADRARKECLKFIMRQRGSRKPVIVGHGEPEIVYFPYWVYYCPPRRGRLAIRLVDGSMGEVPGARMRLAVLEAFIAKDAMQGSAS